MSEEARYPERSAAERFFGGRPVWVVVRLVLVSLLVGFVMSVFGFNAADLVHGAVELMHEALRDSAGLLRQVGGYVATGAALVIPIWLLLRLTRAR